MFQYQHTQILLQLESPVISTFNAPISMSFTVDSTKILSFSSHESFCIQYIRLMVSEDGNTFRAHDERADCSQWPQYVNAQATKRGFYGYMVSFHACGVIDIYIRYSKWLLLSIHALIVCSCARV
jgi:hypothetical protein